MHGMAGRDKKTPIELIRRARGLSGYAFAKAVGTTPSHIARVERGQCVPSVDLALRIADVLKADVRTLFRGKAA